MADLSTELLIANNKAIENLTNISSKLVFIVDKLYEKSPDKSDIAVIKEIKESLISINSTLVLLKSNNVDINIFKTETLNLKVLIEDLAKVVNTFDFNKNYDKLCDIYRMLTDSKDKSKEFLDTFNKSFENANSLVVSIKKELENFLILKNEIENIKIEINKYNNYIENRKENIKSEIEVNKWLYQIVHQLEVNKNEISGKDIANSIDTMIQLSEIFKKFHTYRYVIITALGMFFTFLTFKDAIRDFLSHLLKVVE